MLGLTFLDREHPLNFHKTSSCCTIPVWPPLQHGSFGRSEKRVKEEICLETGVGKVQLLLFPFPEILYINRFICSETASRVLAPPRVHTLAWHFSFQHHLDSWSTTPFSNPGLIMSKCDPYFDCLNLACIMYTPKL